MAGILRVQGSALELAGVIPPDGPRWYLLLQAAIGIVQFVIAIQLLRGYRRSGPWGRF